jgi:hypothetical protein
MSLSETVKNKNYGLYYGSRLILPFKAHFLKIILNDDIYTDFSPGSKTVALIEQPSFTDVYFKEIENIADELSRYESIKMVVVEIGKDIFDFNNHLKIALYPEEKHRLKIELTDEDILFIE